MRPLLRILGIWRSEAPALGFGLLTALLSIAAVAALALAAGAVPAALGGVVAVAVLRFMGVARVGLRYMERLATHAATFRAQTALRVWMFRGLARRSAGGLGFLRRGDALARLVGDVDALDGLYLRIIVPLAALLLLLLAVAIVLGRQSPALAVAVCLLLGLGALLIPWIAAGATVQEGGRLAEAASGLRVAALDALGGMREVRAFGNEGRMLAVLQAREAGLFDAQRVVARHAALAQAATMLCAQAALLLVVLAGLPVAAVLPCVLLTVAAFEAAAGMPRAGALAGHAAAAAARVLAVADPLEGDLADPQAGAPLVRSPGAPALRFEAVGFAWPGRAPVFDGLTLDIPPGARVAILGPSGSGKSTLAALALKVVAPHSGRVLLGGADIATLRTDDVRAQVAWLSQATHVFSDTVRENLLLGRPGADDAALWLALNQAGLADVVRDLPEGLDTWIGEGGAGLSGGQLRRVALARALLSTAPILILDEPATGLDDAGERAFFTTLNEAAAGRTVVLIVHRLLGVERLDRIWRLSGGHAVAATG
jgi:ATP-binding cassette subfamily C protein CydC